jgi:hypothetical protein
LGRQSEQAAKFFLRFVPLALHRQRLRQIAPARQRVLGLSAQLAKDGQGFGVAPLLEKGAGKLGERALEAWLQLHRPL